MVTLEEALAELETRGTAQNRKIYARYGVLGPQFGVSHADLGELRKRIKTDHPLAEALWATGIYDARLLATMVADPERVDRSLAIGWLGDVDNYQLADLFTGLVGRSPLVRELAVEWAASEHEWTGRAGWNLLGHLALNAPNESGEASAGRPKSGRAVSDAAAAVPLPDSFFTPYLAEAERRIPTAANRLREAMNATVIAIGMRNPRLEDAALAAAARIGKVHVDHGETGCKTPDAREYILKAAARRGARGG
jgi:hypothetical protein